MHRACSIRIVVSFAILGSLIRATRGAEVSGVPQGEVAAIRAAAQEYLAAVRSRNIEGIRGIWTPEGDYIDAAGQSFKAHELLRHQLGATSASSFSSPDKASAPIGDSSLRFITPVVAIEDGSADLGVSAEDGSSIRGRFTAVWVKRDGRWLLDSLREAISQSASINDQLQPLSWLLGEWAGVAEDQAIVVSSHWSDGGNYIIREFAVHGGGDNVVTGTERIGWDPVASEIVSWTFDSQGGRSESRWKRDGNRWLVESSKVMSDGKTARTATVYTPRNGDAFFWEVGKARVGEEQLPPLRIEFRRAAEDE